MARVSLMALNMLLYSDKTQIQLTLLEDEPPQQKQPPESYLPRAQNWLELQCEIQDHNHQWDFSFPCLEEWNAVWLLKFLEGICLKTVPLETSSPFVEPHLAFKLRAYLPMHAHLQVRLGLHARPRWVKKDHLVLHLLLSERALRSAAANLRFELGQVRPGLLLPPPFCSHEQ